MNVVYFCDIFPKGLRSSLKVGKEGKKEKLYLCHIRILYISEHKYSTVSGALQKYSVAR